MNEINDQETCLSYFLPVQGVVGCDIDESWQLCLSPASNKPSVTKNVSNSWRHALYWEQARVVCRVVGGTRVFSEHK